MTDVAGITRIVEESFRDMLYPDDEELFRVYDPSIPEFMEMIQGKDWKGFLHVLETSEMPMAQFYGGMVAVMSPEAVHYFAPAFLIFSMNANADVLPQVFFRIVSPSSEYDESDHREWQQLFARFSDQQKRAIAQVVNHYFTLYPGSYKPELAVRNFWARWLSS